MHPKQRIMAIKLGEKIAKNPDYAKHIGVELKSRKRTSNRRIMK